MAGSAGADGAAGREEGAGGEGPGTHEAGERTLRLRRDGLSASARERAFPMVGYFRRSDSEPITPENTNEPYGESPVSPAIGAYFNKKAYTDPALRKEYTNKGFWVNIRLIRYSDVVLMAAEAANEKNIPGEAIDYLEMVRARARGSNTNILPKVTTTDQGELREAIRHERRVELGLEFDRFYDLVRWGIAADVLHAAGKVNYQAKNALLPLPQSEIDKSKGVLVQNPDY